MLSELRATTLHILTPLSQRAPDTLAAQAGFSNTIPEAGVATGDNLVADLRNFPATAHQVDDGGICHDVTSQLLSPRDYWTVAREWLAQFTRQTGIQDTLAVHGHGFWWTLNGQKFVASLTELGNSFAWIDLLLALSQQHTFDRIVVYGHHEAILQIVGEIYGEVDVAVRREAEARRSGEQGAPRHPGLLVVRVVLSLFYFVYSLFRRPEICILSNTNLLRRTTQGSKEQLRDVYLDDVAQTLRARGWRVAVVEKYGANASWAGLAARGFFFPTDLIFYLSTPILGKLGFYRPTLKKWRQRWHEVKPNLAEALQYRGIDLSPQILPLIGHEFVVHAPDLEVMTSIWRNLLKLWRPWLLHINGSYNRAVWPAIVAAKSLEIPTVEQQHGLIGRNHIAYLLPRDLGRTARRPLCDMMAVWGEYTQRFLVDHGIYEPQDVVVCGFPRIDDLLGNLPPRDATLARLGIAQDERTVLYTSNGFAQDLIPEILDGIQQVPGSSNIHWLVKLHPREKTRHLWQAAIEERQLSGIQVLEEGFDFYALLAACDLHVSFASTTLIESAILGKPNLGLDVPYLSDPAGYAQARAFLPVKPEALGQTAADLLNDPAWQQRLHREQKAFAEDWCRHDPGTVARIVDLLESVAGRSGQMEGKKHVKS